MSPAQIVNDIVNILGEGICSEKNFSLGGTKNTLKQCIKRNKGIGSKVVTMLTNMILKHPEKRNEINIYLKQFLSEDELQYIDDVKAVLSLIAKKISDKNKKNQDTNYYRGKYKIVDISTLQKMGWTIRDYVEAATLLSYETIDGLTDEHNGEIEEQIPIITEQPENRRILLDENNKMIGMWSFKPFYDDIFQKAKNGELFDSEIKPSMMPTLIPGVYNVYFSNICLKKQYRKTMVFKILLFSVIELIEKWAEEGIFIDEICAQAYSDSGKNLCKSIGLKFIKHHGQHGEIYCGKVYDLVERPFCEEFINARKLYREFKAKHV